MSIYNLVKNTLSLTTQTKIVISEIDKKVNESFSFKANFYVKKNASRLKEETLLQRSSANAAEIEVLGFHCLIERIESVPPHEPVVLRPIESNNWAGAIYYSEQNELFGVMIAKKRRPNWKTPPNWDGSEKQLAEYNIDLQNSGSSNEIYMNNNQPLE